MTMNSDQSGLTVKELVLRLDAKIDTFITVHEARHTSESLTDFNAHSEPGGSAAGRALQRELLNLTIEVGALTKTVGLHERTIQRIMGAMALLSVLGIGTVGLVILRMSGFVP
jgi:hypothetical protein